MSLSKTAVKRLRDAFLDEQVSVFLKDMNIVTVSEEQGEIKISMVVEGYVIDIDADMIYLGLPDGTVTRTVPHSAVGLIEIPFVGETFDMDIPVDGDVH